MNTDEIRISFDFDNCLSREPVQKAAKELVKLGYEVWIVTSRFDNITRLKYPDLKDNSDIFEVGRKIGIPPHRIAFTNQKPKWIILNQSPFLLHVDDDKKELEDLSYYNIVKGIDSNSDIFYARIMEYLKELKD